MVRTVFFLVVTFGFVIGLFGIYNWKHLSRPFKWLVIFLIFTSLSQYFATLLRILIGHNVIWYKVAILVEHTLKFLIFVALMKTSLMKRATRVLFVLSFALILYLMIPEFMVIKFSTYPLVVEYLTVCIYACLYLFEMMKSSSIEAPHQDETFWLAFAMFFYQLTSIAYFAIKDPMWNRDLYVASLEYINYALMTIYYVILLVSLKMHINKTAIRGTGTT